MRLNNNWIKVGALVAALGVTLGAFAVYGLDGFLTNRHAGQTEVSDRDSRYTNGSSTANNATRGSVVFLTGNRVLFRQLVSASTDRRNRT